jgi:hypothetical protein
VVPHTVSIGMAVSKNLQCMLRSALRNLVSRRFGNEPDEGDLQKRGKSLYEGGCPPGPVAVDIVSSEGELSSNNTTKVPGS